MDDLTLYAPILAPLLSALSGYVTRRVSTGIPWVQRLRLGAPLMLAIGAVVSGVLDALAQRLASGSVDGLGRVAFVACVGALTSFFASTNATSAIFDKPSAPVQPLRIADAVKPPEVQP